MTATLQRPEPSSAPEPRRSSRPRRGGWIVPLLLMLAGISVLLYPVVATQFNNVKQREFAQQYNHDVEALPPEFRQRQLAAAREYNQTLTGVPILDPYLLEVAADPGSEQYKAYTSQLNESETMASIRVPSGKIDLPVRHGTSDKVIGEGAGHLYGTSLPVGGEGTHAVLTSHTGMANATLFDHLTSVKEGDLMFVDVMGETLAYKVDQIKVVLPTEIGDLTAVPGHDYLTLFTCTPYAVNTHRLLVRGERVPYTPEMAAQAPQRDSAIKMEAWMWGLVGAAALGLLLVLVILWRERRRRAEQKRAAHALSQWAPSEERAATRALDAPPTRGHRPTRSAGGSQHRPHGD